jgi:hypothetical protein
MTTIKKITLMLIISTLAMPVFGQFGSISLSSSLTSTFDQAPIKSKYNTNTFNHRFDFSNSNTTALTPQYSKQPELHLGLAPAENPSFLKNRRNLYSSLWAFASLNYLYADLVGFMDANVHAQYHTGVVDGTKISPEFLTIAAGFMQIPIANVFLPHIIKNENTLRWVQIASGTIMTLVQTATLFVGKPTPYYALFSGFEIAATAYITFDAIKWKTKSKKSKHVLNEI